MKLLQDPQSRPAIIDEQTHGGGTLKITESFLKKFCQNPIKAFALLDTSKISMMSWRAREERLGVAQAYNVSETELLSKLFKEKSQRPSGRSVNAFRQEISEIARQAAARLKRKRKKTALPKRRLK